MLMMPALNHWFVGSIRSPRYIDTNMRYYDKIQNIPIPPRKIKVSSLRTRDDRVTKRWYHVV